MQNKNPRNMEVLFPCYGGFCFSSGYSFLHLIFFHKQCPNRIHHCDDHNAHICEDRHPHIGNAEGTKQQTDQFDTDGEINIFIYNIAYIFLQYGSPVAIFNGSSSISTISAASIAASDPMAPMAIPISALESTGASLIPSPTNASFSFSDFLSRQFFHFVYFISPEAARCKPPEFPDPLPHTLPHFSGHLSA